MKETKDVVSVVEKSEEFVVTDNNHVTKITEHTTTKAADKYMDSIDLSNACREFYHSRKRAAEVVKEKLATSGRQRTTKKKTSIDVAMETLRNEMAGLMDQDLSLMKQLLTLNETIEDLKWQRNYYHSQSSIPDSSCDLNESDWSVSETDMYGSENEEQKKCSSTSPLTSPTNVIKRQDSKIADDTEKTGLESVNSQTFIVTRESRNYLGLPAKLELFLNGNAKLCHEEQISFDLGIHAHEHILRKQITV